MNRRPASARGTISRRSAGRAVRAIRCGWGSAAVWMAVAMTGAIVGCGGADPESGLPDPDPQGSQQGRVLWTDSASMIAALEPVDRAALEPEWGQFLIDSQRQLHLAWQQEASGFGLTPQRVEFSLGSSGAYNWRLIVVLKPGPDGIDEDLSGPQLESVRQWWRQQSEQLRHRAREHAESALAARFG